MNKYNIKQILLIILMVIVVGAVILSIKPKESIAPVGTINDKTTVDSGKIFKLCYYCATKTDNNLYDVAWLKLNIQGDKINGEFQNVPAEKDSKIGAFEGIVGLVDQKSMARTANVWWNSKAEGMEVKEELEIQFGEGSATVGFGEMVDRGDGVYVYKDKKNLNYIEQMNQYDCEYLDEKLFAEKYIKDNIKIIATNDPVLGGTWYVTSVMINPEAKTGEVSYEDGHILSKANLTYTYEKSPQKITIEKFEVNK